MSFYNILLLLAIIMSYAVDTTPRRTSPIGPNRARDLRDGSALPGPSPQLSKQAWHSDWFYRAWFYRAARASIREVLQQPVAATVAPVPKCDLNDAVRDRAHLASQMAHGLCRIMLT